MKPAIEVALVEDLDDIREGLAELINRSLGFECIAAYPCAEDALRELPELAPDVVLMDIGLPGMSGIECIERLKTQCPQMQIMMLTIYTDDEKIFNSLEAGASGYILKKTPQDKLLEAIRDLHHGGSPMSGEIARKVVQAFQKTRPPSTPTSELSKREQEILAHLSKGFLYKEIAHDLHISVETVRTHLRRIYEKLHVRNRAEAMLKYWQK